MSVHDPDAFGRFMATSGTDPATSNVIAEVVIDVWRAYYGADRCVPFTLRFGIAHETQRRLVARSDGDAHPAGPAEPADPISDAQVQAAALAMYRKTNQLSMSGARDLARVALEAAQKEGNNA